MAISRSTTATSKERQGARKASWHAHTKKIIFLASLVVIPIIAFTVTILSIVFSHSIDLNECPNSLLCPYTDNTGPANSSNYYVDFPVGRIAFVSSLSSTISFALVAAMMSMYGYVVSSQILQASKEYDGHTSLPTPYGTSTLIRLLNAETFLMWEMVLSGFRKIVRRKRNVRQKPNKYPRLLRLCWTVLLLSFTASVLIQIANTYFHIVIEAISVTRLSLEPQANHQLSRTLGAWLYDDYNPRGNKFLFSPVLEVASNGVGVANLSAYIKVVDKVDSYLLNYTDAEGISYALIKPSVVDPDLDWTGTGYGVSTRCSAIPRDSCSTTRNTTSRRIEFACSSSSPPIKVKGRFGVASHEIWTYDWHKYMKEPPPFSGNEPYGNGTRGLIPTDKLNNTFIKNLTWESSNALFHNPWNFLAKSQIVAEDSDLPEAFLKSPLIQEQAPGVSNFMLVCNTTVYDVKYTVIKGRVSSLSASKSKGAVAGMVSMMSLDSVDKMATGKNRVNLDVNSDFTTPEAYIKRYELSISKQMSVPLVVHTEPAPATLAQRRNTSVITRLPKVALWLLIVANLLFALLGCVLAMLALKAISPEVHQVHVRLSTAGLAAQLFDPQYARREGRNDAELFGEKNREEKAFFAKRVGVRRTPHGGAEFVTHDMSDDASMEAGEETLTLRHTRTL